MKTFNVITYYIGLLGMAFCSSMLGKTIFEAAGDNEDIGIAVGAGLSFSIYLLFLYPKEK